MFDFFKKNIIDIKCYNDLYAEVFIKKQKNIKYEPGQFLIFELKINGKKIKRAYSLSNDPEKDDYLRFIIKRVQGGIISNYIVDNSKKIKNINVSIPSGDFTFNDKFNKHIFIAGGSGITPIASIINSYLEKKQNNQFILIYGNKNKNEIILDKELRLLSEKHNNLKIISLTSDGSCNDDGILCTEGILDQSTIKNCIEKEFNIESCFYVCGPEIVIENSVKVFNEFSVSNEKIKIEKFISIDNEKINVTSKKLSLKIIKNNQEIEIVADSDKTILENCLSNDIPINFSCMSGICTHCKVIVEDKSNIYFEDKFNSLSNQEKNNNVILSCCSKLKNNNKIMIDKT